MSADDAIAATIDKLLADLEIEPDGPGPRAPGRSLEGDLGSLLDAQPGQFLRVGLDAAVFAGFAGDWELSLRLANRLVELNDDRFAIKVWQLRCLVELDRFAEAVALSSSLRWPADLLIHANYLTGNALEALGVVDQARTRYRAVYDANPTYRDVALRLASR